MHFFPLFLGKKPTTLEAPSHYFHENKRFSHPLLFLEKGCEKYLEAKTPSRMVFADLIISLKKTHKKQSNEKIFIPEFLSPRRR